MLTRPSDFEQFSQASGEQLDTVVAVSDGSDTWYFSGRPMPAGLNTAPVYPMLIKHSNFTESVDIYGKKFSVSDITVTLSNRPYYPTTGSRPKRASDLVGGANGGSLRIYQMAGSDVVDIADCLLVFDGNIITCPSYTQQEVTIQAVDKGKMLNVTLPQFVVKDKWPNAPPDSKTQPIPIVYGLWDKPDVFMDNPNGTGCFRGVVVESDKTPVYVLSEHELNDVTNMYIGIDKTLVGIQYVFDSYTEALGHHVGGDISVVFADFTVDSNLPGLYDDEAFVAQYPTAAHDNDPSTQANFKDNRYDSGNQASGTGMWRLTDSALFRKYLSIAGAYVQGGYWNLEINLSAFGDYTDFSSSIRLFYKAPHGAAVVGYSKASGITFGDESQQHHLSVDQWGAFTYEDLGTDLSDIFCVDMRTWIKSDMADGTLNNQVIAHVGEVRLRVAFDVDDPTNYCWCSGSGIVYGSWIDNAARSNSYNIGDVVEDPASIIEDLFRRYLGLDNSDIDVESFDAALNSSVKARLNLLRVTKLYDIARQISEQSTFAVFYSGVGKLKLIPLNDENPDIAAVIPRDRIVNDNIKVSKTGTVINKMAIKSRWHGERGTFIDSNVYEDTVSQSNIQSERAARYEWPNVVGDSAVHIAEHLVNDTNGIWSKQHTRVELLTPGFTYSYLQPGDWIRLAPDVDGIVKPYGGTWEGRNLLVVETSKGEKTTEITAVELYE